ncbi:hypothetical protein MUK42_36951 [Musa troglodytarum]|uniref:Uncharacterized protein n=1 Tax=Musa troglodytarum TaxID=320322 RepID=A0A9E7FNT4_9LILI|nr:hypothetical protein MUK42_36951 [Musa troglodytarum]
MESWCVAPFGSPNRKDGDVIERWRWWLVMAQQQHAVLLLSSMDIDTSMNDSKYCLGNGTRLAHELEPTKARENIRPSLTTWRPFLFVSSMLRRLTVMISAAVSPENKFDVLLFVRERHDEKLDSVSGEST